MTRKAYHTDLKDKEWELIEECFKLEKKKPGRPRKHTNLLYGQALSPHPLSFPRRRESRL
jgi:hypothetical protein